MPSPPTPPPTTMAVCLSPAFAAAAGEEGSAMLARTPARDERAGERRHVAREDAAGTRAWANIARLCRGSRCESLGGLERARGERAGRSEAREAGRGLEGRRVVDGSSEPTLLASLDR